MTKLADPTFSVLIPSRNRLNLLRFAVESVLRQSIEDWEIVISDNASEVGYQEYVESLNDPRIVLVRSDLPLSVTDNWNRTVESSRGRYIVMLGDDDALAPGYFEAQAELIEQFDEPELIYSAAYHYAYPSVVPNEPAGYFVSMNNSTLFRRDDAVPYLVDIGVARDMGRMALRFRHEVSFNAQHFLYSRRLVDRLKQFGPLYQSPYPDYYSCFMTFMRAERIVADPRPRIIIGISSHSFGYFFLNNREEEGASQFLAAAVDTGSLVNRDSTALAALELPGSAHTRNWLIAALLAQRRLSPDIKVEVDLRRYARIQIFDIAQKAAYDKTAPHRDFWQALQAFSPAGQRFGRRMYRLFLTMDRTLGLSRPSVAWALRELLRQYLGPHVERHELGSHSNVMDAFAWIEAKSKGVATDPTQDEVDASGTQDATPDFFYPPVARETLPLLQALRRNKRVLLRVLTSAWRAKSLADFDPVWYMQAYPDVAVSRANPLKHFLRFGLRESRFPNVYAAHFDRDWYLATYQDVASAGADPFEHFIRQGASEGRLPHAGLENFDAPWYEEAYPDVKESGLPPILHFLRHGQREGRAPNLLKQCVDTAWYLREYPDVVRAGMPADRHFATYGAFEDRAPSAKLKYFDAHWYTRTYPDVAASGEAPLLHYLRRGLPAGRSANAFLRDFDRDWYARQYADVAAAGVDPLEHFVSHGAAEGRLPNANPQYFDSIWYAATYAEVGRSGLPPMLHYLMIGAKSGRAPNALAANFDPAWYLSAYPDVARAGIDPLQHFLQNGMVEGRRPNRGGAAGRHDMSGGIAAALLQTGEIGTAALMQLKLEGAHQAVQKFLPFEPLNVTVDSSRGTEAKLRILLPSVRKEHATGGPNTAFLLGVLLARRGIRVSFVSTSASPDADSGPISDHLQTLTGSRPEELGISFEDASDAFHPLQISRNDVLFATAWWTAQAAHAVLPQTQQRRFYYLIQDFEPLFHAASENWSQAIETYTFDHVPVINTTLLRDHLKDQAIGQFADPTFVEQALVFEPAVDRTLFHPATPKRNQPRRLLFYARPTIAQRNLFGMGVAALKAAVTGGLFGDGGWEFLGIGERFDAVPLGRGMSLVPAPWQNLDGYAAQMRSADLLLSLMLSPHPSYPPLEMAACGGAVVTTVYGSKTALRLSRLSTNIIGVPPTVKDLVWGLQRAIRISDDPASCTAKIEMPSNWHDSISPVLPSLLAELAKDGIVPVDRATELPSARTSTALAFVGELAPFYRAREQACVDLYRPAGTRGLISLLTTVYDTAADQLADLAHSVFAQDSDVEFEWVLLDNGSSKPETLELLERLRADKRVRFGRVETNVGIIRGMRWCLEQAKSRYVVPIDSDDLLFPHTLRVVCAFIEQAGFPPLVYTDEDKTDGNEQLHLYAKPDFDPVLFIHSCFIAHVTAIDRQMALELACYSDSSADGSHDWDSFVRFVTAGHVPLHIAEPLYSWRMHAGSTAGNYRSKDYIYQSQRFVLQNFLRARGLEGMYEIQPSPIFGGTPDWRFAPIASDIQAPESQWLASLVLSAASTGNVTRTINIAMIDALPEAVTHVHLRAEDCAVLGTAWAEEARTLMHLFPDTVMVGGRIHDGERIREAVYVWGYGGIIGCPDVGRALGDPGYFAQMWKPRSGAAVSARHCVVKREFLRDALGAIGNDAHLDSLGLWLGAMASEHGARVVYTPFFEARLNAPVSALNPTTLNHSTLAMRFGHRVGDCTGYSPRLDRGGKLPYTPGDGEAVRDLPAYEDYLHDRIQCRRRLRVTAKPVRSISILTTVYQKTDVDLFKKTAEAVVAQDAPPLEWLVLAHGPISAELDQALELLAASGSIRLLRLATNLGIAGGLRHCLEAAQGEFVIPLDADDLLVIDAVAVLSEGIDSHPEAHIIYSDEDLLIDGSPRHPYARPDFDPALLCAHSFVWHAIAFRRTTGLTLGAFTNRGAEYAQDWDVLLRFMHAGYRSVHLPEVLYHWRQHPQSLSHSGQVFEGSLASVRHLLGDIIRSSDHPERYEVQTYPHRIGDVDYYIRRLPENAPRVLRVDLGERFGSPYGHDADSLFPFVATTIVAEDRGHATLDALEAALAGSDAEMVLLLGAGVSLLDANGLWQAIKQLELLPDAMAVGGPLVDFGGQVRFGSVVETKSGDLADPVRGKALVNPGPFSLALKPHCVTLLPVDLMLARRAWLLEALRAAPAEVTGRGLGAWLGRHARANSSLLVYEPLLCAGVDRPSAQIGDPLESLQRAWQSLAPATKTGQKPPIQGLAGFAWHSDHHA